MNKKLRVLFAAILALALLAGCNSDIPAKGDEPAQSPASAAPAAPSGAAPAPSVAGPAGSFRPGTWEGEGMYYFFEADGSSGSTASMENGMGMPFSYEVEGETVTFHMGSVDDSTVATLAQAGEAEIVLNWADGLTETLHYVSGAGAAEFKFYSNEELCDLAVAYYQGTNGGSEPLSASATVNPDGTLFIQIASDQGDHLSNLAQYDNVDRFTAAGTDAMTDAPVNLTQFKSDGSYQDAADWFRSQTNVYQVIDGTVCGDSVVLLTQTKDPATNRYEYLQVFVVEQRGGGYEAIAWRDGAYGTPAGFTAYVLATDELTVVFGDADTRPFTEAHVIFDNGDFEIRPVNGYSPYVIAFEGRHNVADVAFMMEGIEVKYSEYFSGNLMDDSASIDVIPFG